MRILETKQDCSNLDNGSNVFLEQGVDCSFISVAGIIIGSSEAPLATTQVEFDKESSLVGVVISWSSTDLLALGSVE